MVGIDECLSESDEVPTRPDPTRSLGDGISVSLVQMEQLAQQLTCPICFELLEDPCSLGCDHATCSNPSHPPTSHLN